MKIIHIESGLGNQMLSYCEFLVQKKLHPDEDIYIETIVFDIPEANEIIKQWNGYELDNIFGIKAPNIADLFSKDQWGCIMKEVRESLWWEKNWNYPVYIVRALQNAGLDIINIRGDFESLNSVRNINMKKQHIPSLREKMIDTRIGEYLKRNYRRLRKDYFVNKYNHREKIFYSGSDNVFTGQWLSMKFKAGGMDFIRQEVKRTFVFPSLDDPRDIEMASILSNKNSVAIHARRGDMLGCNGYCYKYGYFRRAVKYIKKRISHPVFVFFCDPGSIEWCKMNGEVFSLDFQKDNVLFVDWHTLNDSFRDMQLISKCKHAIITNSSFGWWGAYLIDNPNKITISPWQEVAIDTTNHC